MERLLQPTEHREVIVIVGMGGIGKTTLASLVFNKARGVEERNTWSGQAPPKATDPGSSSKRSHFDVCAWVPVGQDPDTLHLFSTISIQIGANLDLSRDVAEIKHHMFTFLLDKRYLIVLDDVWREETWHELVDAFPMSTNGSKILMTTRSKVIAISADPASYPHELNPLSDEVSFHLFLSKVFPNSNLNQAMSYPPLMEDLGRQLSKKCGGLPLALVVLGGLLSAKEKKHDVWSSILNSMNWNDNEAEKQCLKILALSYDDLPYRMKLCFLYLGAFREESEISISKLTKLWIGDDLIPQQSGRRRKEDTATDYLNELIQRCLVQPVLLKHKQRSTRVIRPFFPLIFRWCRINWQTVWSMPYIRVIEVEGLMMPTDALRSIQSSLIHLRYLCLRNTQLVAFPFNESKFPSLQTLDIRETSVKKLPDTIWALKTLRHLYLNGMEPPSIRCLTNLQTFCGVLVSNDQIAMEFLTLKDLRKLQIELKAWNGYPLLVKSLKLLLALTSFKLSSTEISSEVINKIAHHSPLRKLHLQGMLHPPVLTLSEYFSDYITSITLSASRIGTDQLKTLGSLTCLWELKLKDDALLPCPQHSFPQLGYLKISSLTNLEAFRIERGAFSNLVRFSVHYCSKFRSIIDVLEHTTSLQVLKLKGMELLPDITDSCRNKNVSVITMAY
ncbi:hypothetical protein OsJ_36252 [Oryza sativa Japonica Group]|uniref:NB-ARC domain-containing protein n=1 Tax=Oryza sativa subsp. japonica TaxID=39947 RepID=B9GDD6_ORYSJ|nr:hypothetical protein OsJ_36252 [Oryza sativa Japonica Group]